jgi:diacylglycerol kinase family enzyme
VQVDEAEPVNCEMVIVSNIRNYGGLFTAADLACCDSGHLDVCALERAGIPALVGATWSAFRRGLSGHPGVRYMTGRRILVRSEETVPVEVDGDPAGMTPVDISVLPRVVPVVVPAA